MSASDGQVTIQAGSIPIYMDGQLIAGFTPDDLDRLEEVNFVDAEEGKRQQGWMLRDVMLLKLGQDALRDDATFSVSGASRGKGAQLTWLEIEDPDNMVMLDLSGRGTLKLVSLLERLNTRDEWVQDVDRIEVSNP